MKNLILMSFLIMTVSLYAQDLPNKKVQSKINEVTVFLQGAQVNRSAESTIASGTSIINFNDLSPFIDDKSIQVKAEGDFTVLSVMHSLDYLSRDSKNDSLSNTLENVENEIAEKQSRLEILKEKESLLDQNKDLNGDNKSASLAELKQAIDFYDRELTQIKEDYRQTQSEIIDLQKILQNIQSEMADVSELENLPKGKISVKVEAQRNTSATFKISYLVNNAGWFPNYDLRAKNTDQPIALNYKANVHQNTGNDWTNVKLKLSSGNPSETGVAPELETWHLNYPRNTIYSSRENRMYNSNIKTVQGVIQDEDGMALPGVNVIVKGTTIGTQTDFDGRYQIAIPSNGKTLVYSYVGMLTEERAISSTNQNVIMKADAASLDEVVIVGYGGGGDMPRKSQKQEARQITTVTSQKNTSFEFEVDRPYTINSSGENVSVNISSLEIDAEYQYHAIPKIEEKAYLVADITNWDQYNLLQGETSLFFDGTYVGKTILDTGSMNDTLNISLGPDSNIIIDRQRVEQFSKKRFIGSNKIDTREFKISVRNKKAEEINITVMDQIPVSANSDIEVELLESTGGNLDKKTGKITWDLKIPASSSKEFILKYEVKYPKNEKLILE